MDPGLRRDRLYNGFEQLTGRVITNSGAANGTVYSVHDVFGNVIAELNGTGATVREYIWLPEAEISPTMGSRTVVDRPMAVVSGVNTTPTLLMVHVDHLHRPVKMTNGTGTAVWSAVWLPWGGAHTITGAEINDARFPGKWFQLEADLHYNWHRAYDPSLGRYTQPDPLGFVDGPGIFSYASGSPYDYVDPTGLYTRQPHTKPPPSLGAGSGGGNFPWPSWTKPKPVPVPVPVPIPPPTLEPNPPRPETDPAKCPERCNKVSEKEHPDGGRTCLYICDKSGQFKVIYTTPKQPY